MEPLELNSEKNWRKPKGAKIFLSIVIERKAMGTVWNRGKFYWKLGIYFVCTREVGALT